MVALSIRWPADELCTFFSEFKVDEVYFYMDWS
jgi:hypothetical protein